MKLFIALLFALTLLCTTPARAQDAPAGYTYAHTDAEYTVVLPEAPTVKTIWADDPKIPYLENIPQNGEEVGETATFHRIDSETREFFDASITFLKANPDFLKTLTKEKMQATIEEDFKDLKLQGIKQDFSGAPDNPLKWATRTGFNVDQDHRPIYYAEHYMTGQQSITVIRVFYSLENQTFNEYYKKLTDSIKYRPL